MNRNFKVCQGANIRQEELKGEQRGRSIQTLADWRSMLHVIGNGQRRLHGALDTFDYSQTELCYKVETINPILEPIKKKKSLSFDLMLHIFLQ